MRVLLVKLRHIHNMVDVVVSQLISESLDSPQQSLNSQSLVSLLLFLMMRIYQAVAYTRQHSVYDKITSPLFD
ncbi:hypothetical protein FGO68_gene3537 [Halteria grandinella]|uniref:Uncharacterized protein n=1 Tax=Halteria grandinella TaxID=5974 RepID=A0A8J8NFL7_HALGN|nr:hypothetical protein FGO68_gene3537 [Halteria grandinella]